MEVSMNSTYIVKSLWISSTIDDMQILCIKSFLAMGIEFQLYTYNDVHNIPDGVIIKNANDILDAKFIFIDNKQSYATFTDWFRIKLLYDTGGWWVDCDVLLIKPFETVDEYVFATESFYAQGNLEIRICNAVIKMPQFSNIGRNILSKIEEKLSMQSVDDIEWTEIGAGFLKEEIIDNYLEGYVVAPDTFCPNAWNTFEQASLQENFLLSPDTYTVHLWNNMWRWNNLQPLVNLKENSLLAKAVQQLALSNSLRN